MKVNLLNDIIPKSIRREIKRMVKYVNDKAWDSVDTPPVSFDCRCICDVRKFKPKKRK